MEKSSGHTTQKLDRIYIRLTESDKAFLEEAAASSYQTVSEFLRAQGLKAAEQALLDKRVFRLNEEQWKVFTEVLDRPSQPKPELARLFSGPSFFER